MSILHRPLPTRNNCDWSLAECGEADNDVGCGAGDTQELCLSGWQFSWPHSPLFTTESQRPKKLEICEAEVRTVDGDRTDPKHTNSKRGAT